MWSYPCGAILGELSLWSYPGEAILGELSWGSYPCGAILGELSWGSYPCGAILVELSWGSYPCGAILVELSWGSYPGGHLVTRVGQLQMRTDKPGCFIAWCQQVSKCNARGYDVMCLSRTSAVSHGPAASIASSPISLQQQQCHKGAHQSHVQIAPANAKHFSWKPFAKCLAL